MLSHGAIKPAKFVPSSAEQIALKWLLVGVETQTDRIYVITVFILIVFKICGSSKSNNLSFDQNHLIKNPILCCKYISPQKLHRNRFVFKICVWISIFRRKKRFENQIFGCWDIKQTNLLIFFDTPCSNLMKFVLCHQNYLYLTLPSVYIKYCCAWPASPSDCLLWDYSSQINLWHYWELS